MPDTKQTKNQLEKRRDEINDQLNRVNQDLEIKLDRNSEDQAIQVEQREVSVTMEANLRKELNDIDNKLNEFDKG